METLTTSVKIEKDILPMVSGLRFTVFFVALANLAYFFVEFRIVKKIDSVALLADCIDFLEDAAVNLLIFFAISWSAKKRVLVGKLLACVFLLPVLAFIWIAWKKAHSPVAPEAWILSVTGLGALFINLGCMLLLAKFRQNSCCLTRAAFLSARNDVIANIAIIGAGIVTAFQKGLGGWPDLIVGMGIALMNVDSAKVVWDAAKEEQGSGES